MSDEELAELRLLIELRALRRLADRGLSAQELTLVTKLAEDTAWSARRGDVPGNLLADRVFHLCLLELTGDPVLAGIARLLVAGGRCAPPAEEPGSLMVREAREHHELARLLADGMVSAADDLLRRHLSPLSADRPVRVAGPVSISWAGA
jgi:DNA-binding GntR family transcriptional regulator